MEGLIMAAQLILGLSILIVLHEWGHFFPAKLFKTRVEKFYLFFNPYFSLFKKKIGETEYGIGWLPLGGYVKISGMIDESMDKEQMKQPPQPWEFRSKPVWQRLIIMLGGVTVNLILGFLIYAMVLFSWGREVSDPASYENGIMVDSLMASYGFENGDIISDYIADGVKDINAINGDILFMGVRDLTVKKLNGEERSITLPEDITIKAIEANSTSLITPRSYSVVGSVTEGGPAEKNGLLANDSIVALNGIPTPFWDQFRENLEGKNNEEITIDLYREGQQKSISLVTDSMAKIGFVLKPSFGNYEKQNIEYGFFESIPAGVSYGWRILKLNVNSIKYVFTRAGSKKVGSFISFAKAYGPTWDWHRFWSMTALISLILAFMNVLPIPALDGGHVMFLLYEAVSGKPPSQKVLEVAQTIGFFLLIGLIIFALKNDIVNHVFN
ncbi:MAG: RIP metalloprotease RseP [Flavobacteriales bacterium]|nr:RIP metalloprotease RseP [Flavobacteriales bacterium]